LKSGGGHENLKELGVASLGHRVRVPRTSHRREPFFRAAYLCNEFRRWVLVSRLRAATARNARSKDLQLLGERMLVMAMGTSDSRPLNVMKQRERFLAKLSAVCVLLLGTTVMNFAWAAKTAPASHHGDRASTGHGNAPPRSLSMARLGAPPNLTGARLILVLRS
jgi:hypothetical protein